MEILTPDKHYWYDQMIAKGFAERDEDYFTVYQNGDPSKLFRQDVAAAGQPNSRFLDIGCGPGKYTEMVADRYAFIIGLDRSEKSLEFGRKHHQRDNLGFVLGDSYNLPFGPDSFDVVASRLSPHSLSEMMRVLKSGGSAFCMRVGEYDAFAVRQSFDQKDMVEKMGDYIARNEPHSKHVVETWVKAGFVGVSVSEHRYDMHFQTVEDLAKYLSRIPIIPRFDRGNMEHMKILESYAEASIHPESKAVTLHRHRYNIRGFKP